MSNRLRGLDALRGLAALAVVLHHYTARYAEITGQAFPVSFSLPEGHFGVDLFFILSGFVIFMTLERTPRLIDFVGSRVARLWPAYLACMLLTVVVLKIEAPPWYPRHGLGAIVRNLTMMPQLVGAAPIDGSYWSLVYEIMFYGWAAAGFFLAGPKATELLCGFWLAAHFAWRIGWLAVPWHLQMVTAVPYAPLFVIGIMIYRIRARRSRFVAPVLLIASLALTAYGPIWSLRPIRGPVYLLLVSTFALLVGAASWEKSWLGRLRPLVWLGEISYPLYLIHQELGYVALRKLTLLGLPPNLAVPTALGWILLLAYSVSRIVEKPGQKAVRALFAKLGRPQGTPPVGNPPAPAPQELPREDDPPKMGTARKGGAWS